MFHFWQYLAKIVRKLISLTYFPRPSQNEALFSFPKQELPFNKRIGPNPIITTNAVKFVTFSQLKLGLIIYFSKTVTLERIDPDNPINEARWKKLTLHDQIYRKSWRLRDYRGKTQQNGHNITKKENFQSSESQEKIKYLWSTTFQLSLSSPVHKKER